MNNDNSPLARLRHHVTGAIERGEAQAIVEQTAAHTPAWSIVALPKEQGEPWVLLPGIYETLAGAELAANTAAVLHWRTMQVVSVPVAPETAAQRDELLALVRAALNDVQTARRLVTEGSDANPDDMTFDAIENTLAVPARELSAAIARSEGRAQ